MIHTVPHTRDFTRILTLPRRVWEHNDQFVQQLTDSLKRPGGQQSFRPVQAQALCELWERKGLFAPMRVGAGKTLITLLAAYVLQCMRPLLLVPAKLKEKTRREQRLLAQHWLIPNFIRIESYELLGRSQAAELLERYKPDVIILDECHRAKNPKAAVTKRLLRYMTDHPETNVLACSGTITKRSLRDYWHLIRWALKPAHVPLPNSWSELEMWSNALDVHVDEEKRALPGALTLLADVPKHVAYASIEHVREGFRKRLTETSGVVLALNAQDCDASISIEGKILDGLCRAEFEQLRTKWETPDGWPLTEAMAVWATARQLGCGFFYKMVDTQGNRPPEEWLYVRRQWAAWCRWILSNNRRQLDSEKQVRQHLDANPDHYPDGLAALEAWRKIQPTFEPVTVPVWVDESALQLVEYWLCSNPAAIVWCEHVAVAEKLAKRACLSYYGKGGVDQWGRHVMSREKGESFIASMQSLGEGYNFQDQNSRNYFLGFPSNGTITEQVIGRTHRFGQDADEVTFDVHLGCAEHINGYWKSLEDARYVLQTTGAEQKILLADMAGIPDPGEERQGYQWQRTV